MSAAGEFAVHSYGAGVLVDLPLTYDDGDAVRLLVEPVGSGYRVSDRGAAAGLLAMAGVHLSEGRTAEAFAKIMRSVGLDGYDIVPGEVAMSGRVDELAALVVTVARTSLRVSRLTWRAAPACRESLSKGETV